MGDLGENRAFIKHLLLNFYERIQVKQAKNILISYNSTIFHTTVEIILNYTISIFAQLRVRELFRFMNLLCSYSTCSPIPLNSIIVEKIQKKTLFDFLRNLNFRCRNKNFIIFKVSFLWIYAFLWKWKFHTKLIL